MKWCKNYSCNKWLLTAILDRGTDIFPDSGKGETEKGSDKILLMGQSE